MTITPKSPSSGHSTMPVPSMRGPTGPGMPRPGLPSGAAPTGGGVPPREPGVVEVQFREGTLPRVTELSAGIAPMVTAAQPSTLVAWHSLGGWIDALDVVANA